MPTSTIPRTAGGRLASRALAATGTCLVALGVVFVVGTSTVAANAPASGQPTTERIMSDVRDLVELGPRRSGTPGGDRAAEFVKQGLAEAGVPRVWEHNVTTYQWESARSSVRVGANAIDAFPSEHSFFGEGSPTWTGTFSTPPQGLTAPVVDVGNGGFFDLLGKDLRGKVVLFNLKFQLPLLGLGLVSEHLYDPQLSLLREPSLLTQGNPYITNYQAVVREAQKRGAVGFVGVLSDYFASNRYRNEYYRRLQTTLPGFWVTRSEGNRLRSVLRRTPGRKATLELSGRRWATPTRTVLGYLPGKSRETIMVQSHHDSVGPGAVEDASGTASVLALARYYGALPADQRERGLLFTTFDSHFTGYQSHQAFAADYLNAADRPFDVIANTTVEHIAKVGLVKNGELIVGDLPEPRAFFRSGGPFVKSTILRAIRKHDLQRTSMINIKTISPDGNIPTDASFASMAGIPTVSYLSGPVYLYDDADTLDKVATDQLVPVTSAFIDIIDGLDRTPAATIAGR